MIDVTGCQFVVTAVGKQLVHETYGEFDTVRIARSVPDMTVTWVGGEPPYDLFRDRPVAAIGQLASDYKFLAVPVPQTTVEHLAAAVLMKQPAGQHLVDCLIEQDNIDINCEFAAKVTLAERDRCLDILSRAQSDARIMEEDGGDPFVAEYIGDIMKAVRENAA